MQRDQDLATLAALIAELGGSNKAGKQSGSPCDLLLEHLDAARRNLLGSMPGEYRMSLQQAKDALPCIADKSTRSEVQQRLKNLLDPEVLKQRASAGANATDLPPTTAPQPAV